MCGAGRPGSTQCVCEPVGPARRRGCLEPAGPAGRLAHPFPATHSAHRLLADRSLAAHWPLIGRRVMFSRPGEPADTEETCLGPVCARRSAVGDTLLALSIPVLVFAVGIYAACESWWRRRPAPPSPYPHRAARLAERAMLVDAEGVVDGACTRLDGLHDTPRAPEGGSPDLRPPAAGVRRRPAANRDPGRSERAPRRTGWPRPARGAARRTPSPPWPSGPSRPARDRSRPVRTRPG